MNNIEQPLPVQTLDVEASGDEPTEKNYQYQQITDAKQDETSKNDSTDEDEEEEESDSSASTVVSCIRQRISSSSSEYEDCCPVRKSSGSKRLLRLGQKARAMRLSYAKKFYVSSRKNTKRNRKPKQVFPCKEKCESGFSTEESDEGSDNEEGEGTSGPQRSTFGDYTLLENDDSSSSADAANKAS